MAGESIAQVTVQPMGQAVERLRREARFVAGPDALQKLFPGDATVGLKGEADDELLDLAARAHGDRGPVLEDPKAAEQADENA